jgi:predicted alpha/beta-hydrolase family hydrolase
MQRWKDRLSRLGEVTTFDYYYMLERRKRPDPLPQLIAAHREAVATVRVSGKPLILIGKSMGGRIGCHVSLAESISGLICLGYPLCGGGNRSKLRDKILRELTTPVVFVQGTRDPLCPVDLLQSVRAEMRAPNTLHSVEGGDHSLLVRKTDLKRLATTQQAIDDQILETIAEFVQRLAG